MDKLRTLEHHLHIRHGIHTQLLCCLPFLIYRDGMGMDAFIYISPCVQQISQPCTVQAPLF